MRLLLLKAGRIRLQIKGDLKMLNIVIALVLMIKFAGLPAWQSIAIVLIASFVDYLFHNNQLKIDHLRFMTIEKGIMNVIMRMKG